MKVGDIIRRKAYNGALLGPCMRIMHIENDRVYADTIELDNPNVILLKKDVGVIKPRTLIVSEPCLVLMKNGHRTTVSHQICASWEKVYEENTKVIRFVSRPRGYEGTFLVKNIKKVTSLNELYISITVHEELKPL